ncbi:MAG: AAA family ATPase [Butyrivibrio sp.]|nr:AAA family ATPase [Butyrivibrio sp.]
MVKTMIREIHLKNFKSFTDATFNFVGKNNNPKKLILLYGANGSGKTNFVEALDCLTETTHTLNTHKIIMDMLEDNDSQKKIFDLKNMLYYYSIAHIIKEYKTINSSSNMSIEITFSLTGKIGSYYIEFNDSQIISEKLEYTIQKNKGIYFEKTINNERYNPTIFDIELQDELSTLSKKYWGKHSILSILFYLKNDYSNDYIKSHIDKRLQNVLGYFNNITCHLKKHDTSQVSLARFKSLLTSFTEGVIDLNEISKLETTEKIISMYFSSLSNDIESAYYKKEIIEDKKAKYSLYFKKRLSNTIADIEYTSESEGIRQLLDLLPLFLGTSVKDIVIAIDEIDTGIHDLLVSNLVKKIVPIIKGQLILTTHNTMFLDDYDLRDNIYTINISKDFSKTITAITDGPYRIQKSSNTLVKYLKGEYGGIPIINTDFNFDQIINFIED